MQGTAHGPWFHGFMGGYGLWTILGVLLAIFLVAAVIRMARKK